MLIFKFNYISYTIDKILVQKRAGVGNYSSENTVLEDPPWRICADWWRYALTQFFPALTV